MRFFKTHLQPTLIRCGVILLIVFVVIAQSSQRGHTQTNSEPSPGDASEEIVQLLQTADAHFEKQEFTACYDLYLRVLWIDPANQHAREHIFAIITSSKTLADTSKEKGENDQSALHQQRYRNFVRDFLQLLTTQLKRSIEQYSKLTTAEASGENVKVEIAAALHQILQVLQDLKTVYQEFSREDDSGTEKMIERIGQTIAKYEQELARYQE